MGGVVAGINNDHLGFVIDPLAACPALKGLSLQLQEPSLPGTRNVVAKVQPGGRALHHKQFAVALDHQIRQYLDLGQSLSPVLDGSSIASHSENDGRE